MHTHALDKRQTADEHDVTRNLRADAARIVEAVRGGLIVLAVLRFQKVLKERYKRAFGGLKRSQRIADNLCSRVRGIELHAVGGDTGNGEQVAVAQENRVLSAEDACTRPAAQCTADVRKTL